MPTVILRSLPARVGTAVIAIIALYITGVVWMSDGWGYGLVAASVAGTFTVAVWLLWWVPVMRLDDDGILVRNAFFTWRLGWEDLTDTRTRWGLVLVVGGREIPVSAAGRGGLLTAMRRERHAPATREEYVTPSQQKFSTRLDSDDAAHLVELYQEGWREQRAAAERDFRRACRLAQKRHQELPTVVSTAVHGIHRSLTVSSWVVTGLCLAALCVAFVMKP